MDRNGLARNSKGRTRRGKCGKLADSLGVRMECGG